MESEAKVKVLLKQIIKREQIENHTYEIKSDDGRYEGFLSKRCEVVLYGDQTKKGRKKKVTLNFLLKFAPTSGKFRNETPIAECYKREKLFYDELRPLMDELLGKKQLSPINFVGKCYLTSCVLGQEVIVLENLKSAGYELWDATQCMNDDHVKHVLKTYGKYHAIGYALKQDNRKLFAANLQPLKESVLFTTKPNGLIIYLEKLCCLVIKAFEGEDDQYIYQALIHHQELLKQFISNPVKFVGEDDTYLTLIHGDCWCNNMLFKYENEAMKIKPAEVKFVDFQLVFHASPVMDFCYFFYANASVDMYGQLAEYKNMYYDSLCEELRQLGLDPNVIYPRKVFENHFKNYAMYGMIFALPILYEKSVHPDWKDHEDLEGTDQGIFEQFSLEGKCLSEFYHMVELIIRHFYKERYLN